MPTANSDDRLTLAALGVLAFIVANVSHEAVGHGLATLAVGGRVEFVSTCYVNSSGNYSKWIPAAGGLTNLAVGLGSVALLRLRCCLRPRLHYFLILVAAFNLFFAVGYPAYSGIAQFGDWAAVINGLNPPWIWRVVLVAFAVAGYYASMRLLVEPLSHFAGVKEDDAAMLSAQARIRRMTLIPYIASMVVACAAASLNPRGPMQILTAGLPAAAAAFGLTQMDNLVIPPRPGISQDVMPPLQRSVPWIAAAAIVLAFFVAVLGRGIRFST
ncbi:MAG TPA: hypothetical protein VGU46_10175 [Acidobacteriaceae bacterium]|nr:hypothetical protein [Acidobacteriaceae bacterium]